MASEPLGTGNSADEDPCHWRGAFDAPGPAAWLALDRIRRALAHRLAGQEVGPTHEPSPAPGVLACARRWVAVRMDPDWLDIGRAAELLGLSEATTRELVRSGTLGSWAGRPNRWVHVVHLAALVDEAGPTRFDPARSNAS